MYKDLKMNDTVNYMKIIFVGLSFRAQLQHMQLCQVIHALNNPSSAVGMH